MQRGLPQGHRPQAAAGRAGYRDEIGESRWPCRTLACLGAPFALPVCFAFAPRLENVSGGVWTRARGSGARPGPAEHADHLSASNAAVTAVAVQVGLPIPEGEARWQQALEALKEVWASKYNDRAFFSCKKVGLNFDDVRMAVLVQRVVPAR